MHVVAVTDDAGALVEPNWLARAEVAHRQLRPQLPPDYVTRLTEVFADGARMAAVVEGDSVLCVAVWRLIENTFEGCRLYVDDLVSDELRRSQGAGKMMLDWLGEKALGDKLEKATAAVIAEGKVRTYDMGGSSKTLEMAKAIADKL